MAQSLVDRHCGVFCLRDEVLGWARETRQRFMDYRAYRRTQRELAQLNEHVLADLGLHRSEIRRVAYDSVYGARR